MQSNLPDEPLVSCLCPTYLRPRLLENAIACFLEQDYPNKELVILDDAGQIASQSGPDWELVSISRRFRSLPEKFNALVGLARGSILVVWEDDDAYLPWHLSAHVETLKSHFTSKPSRVLSTYTGRPEVEQAAGRFHASIAFWRDALKSIGGWPVTSSADFDQQLIAKMAKLGAVGDPSSIRDPSYVFRWGSTMAYHGQAMMSGPQDTTWYDKIPGGQDMRRVTGLMPCFDLETLALMEQLTK